MNETMLKNRAYVRNSGLIIDEESAQLRGFHMELPNGQRLHVDIDAYRTHGAAQGQSEQLMAGRMELLLQIEELAASVPEFTVLAQQIAQRHQGTWSLRGTPGDFNLVDGDHRVHAGKDYDDGLVQHQYRSASGGRWHPVSPMEALLASAAAAAGMDPREASELVDRAVHIPAGKPPSATVGVAAADHQRVVGPGQALEQWPLDREAMRQVKSGIAQGKRDADAGLVIPEAVQAAHHDDVARHHEVPPALQRSLLFSGSVNVSNEQMRLAQAHVAQENVKLDAEFRRNQPLNPQGVGDAVDAAVRAELAAGQPVAPESTMHRWSGRAYDQLTHGVESAVLGMAELAEKLEPAPPAEDETLYGRKRGHDTPLRDWNETVRAFGHTPGQPLVMGSLFLSSGGAELFAYSHGLRYGPLSNSVGSGIGTTLAQRQAAADGWQFLGNAALDTSAKSVVNSSVLSASNAWGLSAMTKYGMGYAKELVEPGALKNLAREITHRVALQRAGQAQELLAGVQDMEALELSALRVIASNGHGKHVVNAFRKEIGATLEKALDAEIQGKAVPLWMAARGVNNLGLNMASLNQYQSDQLPDGLQDLSASAIAALTAGLMQGLGYGTIKGAPPLADALRNWRFGTAVGVTAAGGAARLGLTEHHLAAEGKLKLLHAQATLDIPAHVDPLPDVQAVHVTEKADFPASLPHVQEGSKQGKPAHPVVYAPMPAQRDAAQDVDLQGEDEAVLRNAWTRFNEESGMDDVAPEPVVTARDVREDPLPSPAVDEVPDAADASAEAADRLAKQHVLRAYLEANPHPGNAAVLEHFEATVERTDGLGRPLRVIESQELPQEFERALESN